MTDSKLIRQIINSRGLKMKYIAERIGITRYSLQKKIDNITEFKSSEIDAFCNAIGGLSLEDRQRIFFANVVDN